MVVVIRVKPIYVERLIYSLVILLLLGSTVYFYLQGENARENNTIIVTGTDSSSTSQQENAVFEELDIGSLEEEVVAPQDEPEEEEPEETCTDRIRNQDETGVDCGGVCAACAVSQPITPAPAAASGSVDLSILDYDYEWTGTTGKITNLKISIFNDFGESIDDGVLKYVFYASSDDLELKQAFSEIDIPSIADGTTHREVYFTAAAQPAFTTCCRNKQSEKKTLELVFESKEHKIKKTVTKLI